MKNVKNNEKNKSVVILSPEAGVKISGASVESVVNARAKTKRYSVKRDLYGDFAYAQPLKMTMISCFALFFSLINISESRADDLAPTSGTCNTAGTCLWSIDSDGTMNIYSAPNAKDVVMSDFICDQGKDNRPWKNSIKSIKKLIVGDNITNIGSNAFESASLKEVYGMKNVKTIGLDAFFYSRKLEYIEMPAVEYLGKWAFTSTTKLTSVDMPNIKTIELEAFFDAVSLQYVGLPVDENGNPLNVNIADNAFGGANSAVINCTNANRTACGSCGNGYVMSGIGCVSNCGAGYLGKEGRCIDSALGCGTGYRQFENFCNRIRYTPAEAAKVLKDDNTNEVTITFKK